MRSTEKNIQRYAHPAILCLRSEAAFPDRVLIVERAARPVKKLKNSVSGLRVSGSGFVESFSTAKLRNWKT